MNTVVTTAVSSGVSIAATKVTYHTCPHCGGLLVTAAVLAGARVYHSACAEAMVVPLAPNRVSLAAHRAMRDSVLARN